LALLFTQLLSQKAMAQLTVCFGALNIIALPADPAAVPL
jgi:DNA helicase-2/ATP-dependent DNA helicase PcrA